MAREGRGLIVSIFKNFINSLKPKSMQNQYMGKDYLGNKYYESANNRGRPARYYVPEKNDTTKFDQGLPAEWESWMRHRRKLPPTDEEIKNNLAMMKQRKENAYEIDEKFKTDKIESPVYNKSFPKYDEYELYPGKKPEVKS